MADKARRREARRAAWAGRRCRKRRPVTRWREARRAAAGRPRRRGRCALVPGRLPLPRPGAKGGRSIIVPVVPRGGRLLPDSPGITAGSGLALMPPFVDSRRCSGRAVIGHRRHAPHRRLGSRAGTGRADRSSLAVRAAGTPRRRKGPCRAARAEARGQMPPEREGEPAARGRARFMTLPRAGGVRACKRRGRQRLRAKRQAAAPPRLLRPHPLAGRRQDLIWPGAAGGA